MNNDWRKSRRIVERVVIEGTLRLVTPTSLSNGEADGLTDISLIKDELTGNALLTGTSICGALRNYLRECEKGFWNEQESEVAKKMFGWTNDQDGSQSLLIIDDAISSEKPETELRDGVKIDGKTCTAESGKKFDLELLQSETEFPLRFELLITEENEAKKAEFLKTLATALQGFELGEIYLGGRKRRGYGECKVEGWKVKFYELKNNLLDWLENNHKSLDGSEQKILTALNVSANADQRNFFRLDAAFAIDGSILIRSGSEISKHYQPDAVHLRSNGKPIISGTSVAGVLRHRALKICNTIGDESKAKRFVDGIFGVDMNDNPPEKWSSRLEVKEKTLKIDNSLVQTRVKIDRFTGGAMDTALFDAAPIFSDGNEEAVELSLKLRFKHNQTQAEKDAEIGLLLLLLKDLWTSDLPVGGESSIGRGRLKGVSACFNYKSSSENWAVCLSRNGDTQIDLTGDKDRDFLNQLVSEHLKEAIKKEEPSNE